MVVMYRRFLFLFFGFSVVLNAGWNFSSRDSRVRLGETNSELILTTAITGWDGTLEIEGLAADRVQGGTITFEQGVLETNDMQAFVTLKYDPTTDPYDKIILEGNDRVRAEPGTILHDIEVTGVYNSIEGQPQFESDIVFTSAISYLAMTIGNELTVNIDANNNADCTVTCSHDLIIHSGAKILDSVGSNAVTVDINNKALVLPGSVDPAWTKPLIFLNADDIQLRAKTILETTWTFKGEDKESHINGHGEILDMSSASAILKVGDDWQDSTPTVHQLYITDCYLKGLSDTTGTFSILSPDAEVILNNVTISLSGDYTFDHGKVKVEGDNCTVITNNFTLTFTYDAADTAAGGQAIDNGDPTHPYQTPTDVHKIKGQLTVDGVTLYYDTLGQPDNLNIQPYVEEDWVSGGEHFHSDNSGIVSFKAGAAESYDISVASYTAGGNIFLGTGVLMNLDYAGTVAFNGNGYYIQFPYPFSASGPVIITAGTNVEFTNVTFKDFDPSYISTEDETATFKFGDGCRIELATNVDLTETWSFIGDATIDGQGAALNLNDIPNGIVVDRAQTLTFEDIRLTGLHSVAANESDRGTLNLIGDDSVIIFRSSQLVLSNDYTFSEGSMKFYEDVSVHGIDHIFTYSSRGQTTIEADATLMFDRGTTLSYEADLRLVHPADEWDETSYNNSRNRIKLNDASARLFLNGCTLWSTHTGIELDTGYLVVQDKVLLKSVAGVEEGITGLGFYATQADGEEAEFASSLNIEILAGATLDVDGHLKYE